jgi:hypothetical protein
MIKGGRGATQDFARHSEELTVKTQAVKSKVAPALKPCLLTQVGQAVHRRGRLQALHSFQQGWGGARSGRVRDRKESAHA